MSDSLSTLTDLFTERRFLTGVVVGVVGMVVLLVVRVAHRSPPWASVVTVATLVGAQHIGHLPAGLVVGVAAMAFGGALVGSRTVSMPESAIGWGGWALLVAGSIVVALETPNGSAPWIAPATATTAIVVGACFSRWSDEPQAPWLGPLFAMTAFGVWITVPDTELAQLLLGVAVVTWVGTLRPLDARATSAGSFALAGTFAWLTMIGGGARPASIIGGWACVGAIVVMPLAHRRWQDRAQTATWQLFAVHAAMLLVAARVIGSWTWAVPAVIAAACMFVVAVFGVRRLGARTATERERRG